MSRIIDATLRFVDNFTKPMNKSLGVMQRHSKEFMRAGKEISNVGKSMERTGKGLTASLSLPIIGAGAAAAKTAMDFEAGMSEVQAISGATGEDLDKLSAMAKEMGAKTKFSATESAEAFKYMAMAGWETEDMLDGIEGVMYLAGATGEDLATVSDIVTDSLSAFGMAADETETLTDVLAQTAASANTNVGLLGESFKYVAPAAGALGFTVEDTAVALGMMANSGIKGSQAGTALNSWLTRMAKPTKEVETAMSKLGLSITTDEGKMKDLSIIMSETRDAFANLTESEKAQYAGMLAGKTGMQGLLTVVNGTQEDFDKLTGAIANSAGAAKEMYDVANDNLKGELTILRSTVESIAISFGEKLRPTISTVTKYAQSLADSINNLSDEQVEMIIKIAGVVAAVGPAIMIFGKMTTGVGNTITAFGKIGKAMKSAGSLFGLITSPAGIVILALAGIVAVGVLLLKNWDKVSAGAKKLVNGVKSIFNECGIDVSGSIDKAGEKLVEFCANAKELWLTVEPIVSTLGSVFWSIFTKVLGGAIGGGIGLLSAFVCAVSDLSSGILSILSGIMTFLTGVFTQDWGKMWQGAVDIFSGIWDTLGGIVKGAINAVIGLINGAIAGINKIGVSIPEWVPGLGGKDFKPNFTPIPKLYKGTSNWQGGPAMVHDKGAEIIDLPKGSRVYPHDKSIQMARTEAKKMIQITIAKLADQIIVREDADIEKLADRLAKKLEDTAANMA